MYRFNLNGFCSTENCDPEVLNQARKTLTLTSMICVDNVPYLKFLPEKEFAAYLNRIQERELRSTDVFSVGFPRSGNHWFFEIISMILQGNHDFAPHSFVDRLWENCTRDSDKTEAEMAAITGPRFMATHLRVSKASNQIADKGVKVVYALRNPKDVLYSWFRLLTEHKYTETRFNGTWEEFFELAMAGEIPFGSWFEHVLDMQQFKTANPSVPVHILLYEKVKANPETEIRRLSHFLGYPEVDAAKIAKFTEFNTMKNGTAKKRQNVEKGWLAEGCHGFMVRGLVGGWKKHFTVDMNERFNREFERWAQKCEMMNLVRKYIM